MNYAEYLKKQGLKEGLKEGLKQGKLEGKLESTLSIAQSMLELGLDIEIILKTTGLKPEDIKQLKTKVPTNH